MKTLNLVQDSPEWHAHRAGSFNASEAAAALGQHKYLSRDALVARIAGYGQEDEHSPAKQALFARGHAAEAAARPVIEADIGEDLFPVIGCWDEDERFSASFDGLTLLGETAFECKLWNDSLAKAVAAGELEPHYYWQLEHQLLVSGAELVIFVCAREDASEIAQMTYRPVPGRREQLIAAWLQVAQDAKSYVPAAAKAEIVGRAPETLPALRIEVTGMVTASNLDEFRATALAVIGAVNEDLRTDEDFADAEKAVKWCGDVEKRLAAAKDAALAQTADIDALFRTIDDIAAEARTKRLNLDKLVKSRKESIRLEIQSAANAEIAAHIKAIDARFPRPFMPPIKHDVAGAMKGKKTVASLKDSAGSEVARVKIEADRIATIIETNLETLNARASAHKFLFNDASTLVLKDPEAVTAIVAQRIGEHEAEQKRKAEEAAERERERIRAEERQKAEAEERARRMAEEEKPQRILAPTLEETDANVRAASGGTHCVVAANTVLPTIVDDQVAEIAGTTMPSADAIVAVIANTYNVSRKVAADWLRLIAEELSEAA